MATTSSGVSELYNSVIADLVPYYMDAVLLPNQQIILNQMSISGQSGNNVRWPLTNAYVTAGTVAEGDPINATLSDFSPTDANVTVTKKGVATDVHEEALEDAGIDTIRTAVLTRLAGGLATATDIEGLLTAGVGATQTDTGAGSTASTHSASLVMSPEALGFAGKREPTVKVWYNPNKDMHEFRGTVRNGFATLRGEFINPITCNKTIGSGDANLVAVAKAVANLRASNAPVDLQSGMYVSIIDPSYEFEINEQVALNGGSAIGSLSDVGNRALMQGLIGQAAGVMFFRSNNLPTADLI